MTAAVVAPALLLFGLCVGSFLNVVIARLPEGRSIVSPGSACPRCGTFIRWFDNVPLISYAMLRGRCRHCREPISARYPLIELVTGLLFLLAVWQRGLTLDLIPALLLLTALVAITAIDLDRQLIPDALSLPGIGVGFAASLLVGRPGWLDSLLGIVVGGGIFFLIIVASRGGMGGGDMKLGAMLGAFLGWKLVLVAILIAVLVGGVVAIGLLVGRQRGRKDALAFGPYLALGGAISLFWGRPLLNWYLGVFAG
ncbi:MAG TPA: prepilin peptidase [Methylomirabilota bacterium]|nr:prepilin peptidase [Methylomirabilota bacterium]